MEEVINILQKWVEYRKDHPNSEFEDFCRFYLASPAIKRLKQSGLKSLPPLDTDSMFMMTVTRTTLAFWVYMRIALKDTPLPSIEDIMFCSALNNLGESRKSDIINYAMMEISTGSDILNRLIKKGFINQRIDPNDKRSKLLTLTSSGVTALKKCYKKASIARQLFLTDITDDDKKLVSHILDPVQEKHSKLSIENKGKTIEEIHSMISLKKKKS